MSTFLELVQDLQREVGASGNQISSVTGQVGENQRLVKWIQEADFYIQNRWLNWKFLWNQVEFTTVPSTQNLAAPTDLNFWDYKTFMINDGGPGDEDGQILAIEYDMLKWQVRDTSEAKPATVIIMPDNSLEFEPIPDDTYQIKADYFRVPTKLAANNDVSLIPENFHQAILARAQALYANYESAPEIKAQAEEVFDEVYGRLENSQLPNQRFSRFQSTGSFFEVNANEYGGGSWDGKGDGYY